LELLHGERWNITVVMERRPLDAMMDPTFTGGGEDHRCAYPLEGGELLGRG